MSRLEIFWFMQRPELPFWDLMENESNLLIKCCRSEVARRLAWPLVIVAEEPFADPRPQRWDGGVFEPINLLVFDVSLQPLEKHVVYMMPATVRGICGDRDQGCQSATCTR